MRDFSPGSDPNCAVSFTFDATILGSENLVSLIRDIDSYPLSWNDVSPPLILVAELVLSLASTAVPCGKLCEIFGVIDSNCIFLVALPLVPPPGLSLLNRVDPVSFT